VTDCNLQYVAAHELSHLNLGVYCIYRELQAFFKKPAEDKVESQIYRRMYYQSIMKYIYIIKLTDGGYNCDLPDGNISC